MEGGSLAWLHDKVVARKKTGITKPGEGRQRFIGSLRDTHGMEDGNSIHDIFSRNSSSFNDRAIMRWK
jgi:hypothetical protein